MTRLDFVGKDEARAERLMLKIEDCDLMIAAAPAESMTDLAVKFEVLLEALAFDPDAAATSLEGVLLLALREDFRTPDKPRLAGALAPLLI